MMQKNGASSFCGEGPECIAVADSASTNRLRSPSYAESRGRALRKQSFCRVLYRFIPLRKKSEPKGSSGRMPSCVRCVLQVSRTAEGSRPYHFKQSKPFGRWYYKIIDPFPDFDNKPKNAAHLMGRPEGLKIREGKFKIRSISSPEHHRSLQCSCLE
jgi:hypothetical protein